MSPSAPEAAGMGSASHPVHTPGKIDRPATEPTNGSVDRPHQLLLKLPR
jgi:hypothetical protein